MRKDLPALEDQIEIILDGVGDEVLEARPAGLRLTEIEVHGILGSIRVIEPVVSEQWIHL
jgi:hypothetical protein